MEGVLVMLQGDFQLNLTFCRSGSFQRLIRQTDAGFIIPSVILKSSRIPIYHASTSLQKIF